MTDLIKVENNSNVIKRLEAITETSDYLPQIRFMTSNSETCKSGEFPINHFAFIKDGENIDMGDVIDVLVISVRPMAMEIIDGTPTSFYHPNFDENDKPTGNFKRVMDKSSEPDSGCMYGLEYLVYHPDYGFATMFFGSKSMRRESKNMTARLNNMATLGPKKIETTKYTWFIAAVKPCSRVIEISEDLNEEIVKQATAFNNPPEKDEVVEEDRTR